MNNGNSLEIDMVTEESQVRSRRKPSKNGDLGTSDGASIRIGRQYIPSDTLQLGYGSEAPRESLSRKMFGSFQFSRGPSLPRGRAPIDLLTTTLCFAAVHLSYLGSLDLTSQRTVALLSSIAFMMLSLSASGIYSGKRMRSLSGELVIVLVCWLCSFAAVGLFAFLTKTAEDVSRVWLTTSMGISLISLAALRVMGCFGFVAGSNAKNRNIVVCGDASSIRPLMRSFYKLPNSRIRIAKVFEFSTHGAGGEPDSRSLESSADQIVSFVESQRQIGDVIEQVWIALPTNQSRVVEELSEALFNSSVDVCVVPDLYTERLLNGEATNFGDTKIVNISEISLPPAADRFKRVFDIVVASAALLVLSVPMAVIAILVKTETSGPALFRQKRYGVDGREIEVLKFRSMWVHSDSLVRQATKNDSRVTRIGKMLRSTSLDELPQLFNVLRGNMSLVGPRPHAVAHNEIWRNQIEGYMLRHKVRPGITGLAQVNGWRGETDTAFKMQQRVKFDLEYIQNWSPWLDVRIMFFTVVKGLRNKNAY